MLHAMANESNDHKSCIEWMRSQRQPINQVQEVTPSVTAPAFAERGQVTHPASVPVLPTPMAAWNVRTPLSQVTMFGTDFVSGNSSSANLRSNPHEAYSNQITWNHFQASRDNWTRQLVSPYEPSVPQFVSPYEAAFRYHLSPTFDQLCHTSGIHDLHSVIAARQLGLLSPSSTLCIPQQYSSQDGAWCEPQQSASALEKGVAAAVPRLDTSSSASTTSKLATCGETQAPKTKTNEGVVLSNVACPNDISKGSPAQTESKDKHNNNSDDTSENISELECNSEELTEYHGLHKSKKRKLERKHRSGAKVIDLIIDSSQLEFIVELPADANPGDRFLLHCTNGACPAQRTILVECPLSVENASTRSTPVRVRVLAPGISINKFEDRRRKLLLSKRYGGFSRSSPKSSSSSVRIGASYQVDMAHINQDIFPTWAPGKPSPLLEQLWDPEAAAKAALQGQDIEAFLGEKMELNVKMLRMETLHMAGYTVAHASTILAHTEPSCIVDVPIVLTKDQADQMTLSWFGRKNFKQAASKAGRSVCACLVHYYNWKKSNASQYRLLKEDLKAEPDYCYVCNDGGELIVCDNCRNSFHLNCLDPPLKQVPSGNWFCSPCVRSPAKRRKLPSGPHLYMAPTAQVTNPSLPNPSSQVGDRLVGVNDCVFFQEPTLSSVGTLPLEFGVHGSSYHLV